MSVRTTLTLAASAAALAGTVALAPVASAAPVVLMGCETQANGLQTCLQFYYPGGTGLGAKASITDPAGGTQFDVRVNDVEFQRYVNGAWQVVSSENDFDGWHADSDVATTRGGSACGFPGQRLRVKATYSWRAADGVVREQIYVTDGTARGMEC